MKKLLLSLFMLSPLATILAQVPTCPLDQAPNVVSVAINQEGICTLYAINMAFGEMGETPTWCYTDDAGVLKIMAYEPLYTLMNLMEMKVDSSGKWLSVYNEGEGHPMVDIYSIADVIWALNDNENPAEPTYTINPYPGYVVPGSWKGGQLEFEADMPFDQFPLSGEGFPVEVLPYDSLIGFAIDPENGAIIRIPNKE